MASDGGTKEYGTETGKLSDGAGRKLAHIEVRPSSFRTTVRVDDPRYEQDLPFGVQTTGNIWRWTQMNPAERRDREDNFFCYGMRGGSVLNHAVKGAASFRQYRNPQDTKDIVGFQPVVVSKNT